MPTTPPYSKTLTVQQLNLVGDRYAVLLIEVAPEGADLSFVPLNINVGIGNDDLPAFPIGGLVTLTIAPAKRK